MNLLPGTTIEADFSQPESVDPLLHALFLTEGLVLSQVARLTGLEAYTIQNWVRRGFVAPPEQKRYSRQQFCRLALINALKDCMQMDNITRLLTYVNGSLTDLTDDLIDESLLYSLFAQLVMRVRLHGVTDPEKVSNAAKKLLTDWAEPIPGARERVVKVLRIMCLAYASGQMQREVERMLTKLPNNEEVEMHGPMV